MKSTDLRAKARAIFGPAIAEPMPNMPNGAKALQQRANARPIPTYKDGGAIKKPVLTPADRKMGDALMMTRKGKDVMASQARMEAEKEKAMAAKRAKADKLLGVTAKKNGGKACGDKMGKYAEGGKVSPFGKAFSEARKAGKKTFEFGGKSYTTETREDVQKRAMAASAEREKRTEANRAAMRRETAAKVPAAGSKPARAESLRMAAERPGASGFAKDRYKQAMKSGMYKDGGKVAKKAIGGQAPAPKMSVNQMMQGIDAVNKQVGGNSASAAKQNMAAARTAPRGYSSSAQRNAAYRSRMGQDKPAVSVVTAPAGRNPNDARRVPNTGAPAARVFKPAMKKGGKVQTSSDTARKLATEMGGMKKGGKTKGKKDGLAVMIAIGKVKPEKKAVGGAGKTRKGMAPIKKAQGGAAKVRKGMMSPTGDIKKVVKPTKGLGGF